MMAGDRVKTVNWTIDYWWQSDSAPRDLQLGNPVATWINQNGRVLDKKRGPEVIKLLTEQFPYLLEVEARHFQLQHARWRK
jgi:hypothetical protein